MTIAELEDHLNELANQRGFKSWVLTLPAPAYDVLLNEASRINLYREEEKPTVICFNFSSGQVTVSRE